MNDSMTDFNTNHSVESDSSENRKDDQKIAETQIIDDFFSDGGNLPESAERTSKTVSDDSENQSMLLGSMLNNDIASISNPKKRRKSDIDEQELLPSKIARTEVSSSASAVTSDSDIGISDEQHKSQKVSNDDQKTANSAVPKAPPKSGYMLFASIRREERQLENRLAGTKTSAAKDAQLFGAEWKALTDEQRAEWSEKCKKAQSHYKDEMYEYRLKNPNFEETMSDAQRTQNLGLLLPFQRVRKIAIMDDDVNKITREALLLITKATEVFVEWQVRKAHDVCAGKGRKTVAIGDFFVVNNRYPQLEFLKGAFPPEESSQKPKSPKPKTASKPSKKQIKISKGTKPITNYFSKQSSSDAVAVKG